MIRLAVAESVLVRPFVKQSTAPVVVLVSVPGSKSVSNRALLLASLGTGTCRLHGLLHSDDTQVMLAALQSISAARYEWHGEVLVVHGAGGHLKSTTD